MRVVKAKSRAVKAKSRAVKEFEGGERIQGQWRQNRGW